MKSTFLNVALLSLLVAAVPVGVSSCKDYDSEISDLQQEDQKIKAQLSALETALQKAQADATEAKSLAQEALNKGLDQQAVTAIAQQAAATAKAEAIAEAIAQCKELLKGYATQSDLTNLASKVSAIETTLNKLGDVDELVATVAGLKNQVAALETFKASIDALGLTDATTGYNALQQLVATINANVTELQNTVNGTATSKGLKELVADISAQVAAINSALIVLQGQTLYGLVFCPEFYYAGVEALEAAEIQYKSVKVVEPTGFAGNLADAITYPTWAQTWSSNFTYVLPDLQATYHLNPSTAVLPTDLAAYQLNIQDVKHIADPRAAKGEVIKAEAEDGLLTVTARLSDAVIKTLSTGDEMTTMQLAITTATGEKGDTVISSDYAAIYPNNYSNLRLFFTTKAVNTTPHTPLYSTAQAAVDACIADPNVCLNLPYDDVNGINIAEYVHTEYTNDGNQLDWDKNATDGIVRKYNFAYQFDLVGWSTSNNDNSTSESAHAALKAEEKDGAYNEWMRAQMVKDGKQQAWGAEQAPATIGRMPIVRVFLVDETSGKNATVGYMVFRITTKPAEAPAPIIIPITPAFDEAWVLSCPLQGFDEGVNWAKVEEQIFNNSQVKMSKAEFQAAYTPDYKQGSVSNGTKQEMAQYVNKDGKFELATQFIGEVTYSSNADPADYGTNVFQWTITGDQLYQLFVTNAVKVTTITTYIHFISNNEAKADIYIALTYTPSSIKYDITSNLDNSLKISNYWYKAWTTNDEAGYGEVRMNVRVPETGLTSADCTFSTEILNWFVAGQKLALSGIDPVFKGLQNADLDKYFMFDEKAGYKTYGLSGTEYQVYIVNRELDKPSELWAKRHLSSNSWETTGQKIAVIEKNPINNANYNTADLTVTYQETGYAKDILSLYDKLQTAEDQTPWGPIAISAYGPCGVPVPVTNNTFNVRFLRPVSMFTGELKDLYDAGTDGVTADLTKALTFKDWRYDNTESLFSTHTWYYNYYGFEKIAIGKLVYNVASNDFEIDGLGAGDVTSLAYTDLGGLTTAVPLTEVSTKLKLIYTPSQNFQSELGSITYYNNGEKIHTEFHIWLPVIVAYKWGWLKPEEALTKPFKNGATNGYIMLTIEPTIGE